MKAIKTLILLAIIVVAAGGAWVYLAPQLMPEAGPDSAMPGRSAGAPAGMGAPSGAPRSAMGGGMMGGGRPVPVNVAKVHKEVFADHIEAIGTASANESITVTVRVQGIIRAINFEDGAFVTKGTEIAAIDAGEQDARLDVELANLDEQRKELERIRGLYKTSNVSQSRLDSSIAAVRKAEANVEAARARVADYRITAPFDGILGTRKVSVGALVTPGTVITTLDDVSVIKLDFAVPENFLSSLRPGLDIEATAAAYPGELFKGEVIAVDSRVDVVTRTVAIRAAIPNADGRLKPGMLMVVDLIKDRQMSLMVPEEALVPEEDHHFVYLVTADDVAERVLVSIGRRRVGSVEVLEGLNEGDLVVIEGTQSLRPKAKVNVMNKDQISQSVPSANILRPGPEPS
ncbi:MAG: efflux RND transporter periplasmic adaptor subunit [Rhodobacteraceae bacterium]|nr:efflux RND transporter periplasmic adaptor subunit [Paracoccaceae bacterium]